MIKKILLLSISVLFVLNYSFATEGNYIDRLTEELSKDSTINVKNFGSEKMLFSTFGKDSPFLPLARVQKLKLSEGIKLQEVGNIISSIESWKEVKVIESRGIIVAYKIDDYLGEKKVKLLFYMNGVILETYNHKTGNYLSLNEHSITQFKSVLSAFLKIKNDKIDVSVSNGDIYYYSESGFHELIDDYFFTTSYGCLSDKDICFSYDDELGDLLQAKLSAGNDSFDDSIAFIETATGDSERSLKVGGREFDYILDGGYIIEINPSGPMERFNFNKKYQLSKSEIKEFLELFLK